MQRRTLLMLAAPALAGIMAACTGGGATEGPPATEPLGKQPERGILFVQNQQLLLREPEREQLFEVKRTSAAGIYYAYPRWSLDGTRLAYVINVQYTGVPGQDWGGDLAISAADGGDERIILKRAEPGMTIEGIAWSPDGESLYASILQTTIRNQRFIGQVQTLERIAVGDGARTQILDDASFPAVAPDGGRIAYVRFADGALPGGLWTAKPDGSDRRLIVPMDGKFINMRAPRFSPDGRRIAFPASTVSTGAVPTRQRSSAARWPWQPAPAAAHGLPTDVWTVPVEGGTPERVTFLEEEDLAVAWSADGGAFAVLGPSGLYRVPARGGGEAVKIGRGALEAQVDWR